MVKALGSALWVFRSDVAPPPEVLGVAGCGCDATGGGCGCSGCGGGCGGTSGTKGCGSRGGSAARNTGEGYWSQSGHWVVDHGDHVHVDEVDDLICDWYPADPAGEGEGDDDDDATGTGTTGTTGTTGSGGPGGDPGGGDDDEPDPPDGNWTHGIGGEFDVGSAPDDTLTQDESDFLHGDFDYEDDVNVKDLIDRALGPQSDPDVFSDLEGGDDEGAGKGDGLDMPGHLDPIEEAGDDGWDPLVISAQIAGGMLITVPPLIAKGDGPKVGPADAFAASTALSLWVLGELLDTLAAPTPYADCKAYQRCIDNAGWSRDQWRDYCDSFDWPGIGFPDGTWDQCHYAARTKTSRRNFCYNSWYPVGTGC
ncbi:MAG: hypothetical protein ABMB14_16560 [Myxococcota bacterium]